MPGRERHRTAERDASLQLVGNAARQQGRVELGVLDLDHVELDEAARQLLEAAAQPIGLGSGTPDDDAGTGGMDVDLYLLVADALDVDAGDGSALELAA
jgi:hypothetical protein